ncbi:nucleoprotein TPR-like isoform X2 [Acanthaster planci]|uniref:Nucleoprotein TPR-like isoform X2 n=1 Tax=Acanthaster planci TaxID=133434 RepID=A0A8B7ZHZ6_ACAPL|nr:nucleoprotein TPR-like isoform X2 [Acanthaster planci]
MESGDPDETDSIRAVLGKTQAQLRLEVERRKEMAVDRNNLLNKLKTTEGEKEDGRRPKEQARKIKLLEEQVQYLEGRLESCRQESALKMASIEGLLGNENAKLKTRDKDLRRKLQRERETNRQQADRVRDLTSELRKAQDGSKKEEMHHGGWMKYVRLPDQGEWPSIKFDTQQNKKALRHIFEQVEKEGGPPVNLEPSLFLHCVILFLWWKREATLKMMEESKKDSAKSEIEELGTLNTAVNQRVRALEDALGDCRLERQTFETTVSTNLNQLLKDKYDLSNKVARLEDTVSALHLDNNLLRAEVNDRSASQQARVKVDELTADLKARLQMSESELRETHLLKEQLEIDLRRESKRLQTLEQDARIKETVCKEHVEMMASFDARKVELETTTSQYQAKVWSLQHDLQNLEESHKVLKKERDSFLGQLTKALDELQDSTEKIKEQNYQIQQMSYDKDHCGEALKQKDKIIGNLRRDLANHEEAEAELTEEKEKRRSLEVISSNHERLVREMEERMRNEEVGSASLLAELCGAHAGERAQLERQIETLEMDREEMVDAIESLSNEKAALRADTQRLQLDFERVCKKLHTVIKRQAQRVLQTPGGAAVHPEASYVDAWTATDPEMKRASPVGGEGLDGPAGGGRSRDLEELFDLLNAVKDSAFSRLMFGVEGVATAFPEIQSGVSGGKEDLKDTRLQTSGNGSNEEYNPHERPRSDKARQIQRDVVAKLRAMALMMQARQKLRGRGRLGRGHRSHADDDEASHVDTPSKDDDCELVNEPLVTKLEIPLLFSPNEPNASEHVARTAENQKKANVRSPNVTGRMEEISEYQLPETPENVTGRGTEVSSCCQGQSDQTSSESENEDLLSTLERERERLKKELREIKNTEAQVQEQLEKERETHLLYLQRVSEYEEECARMQLEKEELLREPSDEISGDNNDETKGDSRSSALEVELERMFLEELAALKEENELLMTERFKQRMILDNRGERLQEHRGEIPPNALKPRIEVPPQNNTRERLRTQDGQEERWGSTMGPNTEKPAQRSQLEAAAEQPSKRMHHSTRGHPVTLPQVDGDTVVNHRRSPHGKNQMPRQQIQSFSGQPHRESFSSQGQEAKALESNRRMREAGHDKLRGSTDSEFLATVNASGQQRSQGCLEEFTGCMLDENKMSHQMNPSSVGSSATRSFVCNPYSSNCGNVSPMPEFEEPVQKTLIRGQEVPICSALAALDEEVKQVKNQKPRDAELDWSIGDDIVTVSSTSEPGDRPEADQDQEHYTSDAGLQRERRPNLRNLSRQDATIEMNHEDQQTPESQNRDRHSDEFRSNERGLRPEHLSNDSGSNLNALSKRHLQKQRPGDGCSRSESNFLESGQLSSILISTRSDLCHGSTLDWFKVSYPDTLEGGDNDCQMLSRYDGHRDKTAAEDELQRSLKNGIDDEKFDHAKTNDSGIESQTGSGKVTNKEKEKAGVLGNFSAEPGTVNVTSSLPKKIQVPTTHHTQHSREASGALNAERVNDKKQVLQSRKVPAPVRGAVTSQEVSDHDQQSTDQSSILNGNQQLQQNIHKTETSIEESPNYTQKLETELSENQESLLQVHRDRQKLQDQLTKALQTEVKLQKTVQGLQNKVDHLQIILNESAKLVASLQEEKEFLKTNFTTAEEERRRIQIDLRRVKRISDELEQQLKGSNEQGKFLKKKHDSMRRRYSSETERNAKLHKQVQELQRITDSEVPVMEDDRGGEKCGSEWDRLAAATNLNREQDDYGNLHKQEMSPKVSHLIPRSSIKEITELQYQLTEATDAESNLCEEDEGLRRQTGSGFNDNDFAFRDQGKNSMGSTLAAVQEDQKSQKMIKTQLEVAKREIQELREEGNLLEEENRRLQTWWIAETGKSTELQKEIADIRGQMPDLQKVRSMENFENLKEWRKSKQKEMELKRQLNEQIDITSDLESQVDDSRAVIKELEQERNILRDDFTNALQKQLQLKTQLGTLGDRCKLLTSKLDDSQAHAQSLKHEMEEYLEQDSQARDEEVRLLKTRLQELRVDRQERSEELAEVKLRTENLEALCKMHSKQKMKDDVDRMEAKANLLRLQAENQEMATRLLLLRRKETDFDQEAETQEASTVLNKEKVPPVENKPILVGSSLPITASKTTFSAALNQSSAVEEGRGSTILNGQKRVFTDTASGDEDRPDHTADDCEYHSLYVKEETDDKYKGLERAHADIMVCSDRLQELEKKLGTTVQILQEDLQAQTSYIFRLRESTETRLQQAVDITKQLSEESQQVIASMVEKSLDIRLKETKAPVGQKFKKMRRLLEHSISEQKKQAASIARLQQTQEKALLQHGALKIRLRQQTEKASGALSIWERERQSLKRQLEESYKSLKLIEKQICSTMHPSQNLGGLEVLEDRLLAQQADQMKALQKVVKNCPCRKEFKQERQESVNTKTIKDRQKITWNYMKTLTELEKENRQLSLDLRLARESLETSKQECWRLQGSLQDASLRETELTGTLRQLQDQLKIEVEMQATLAKRSEDQEAEIFRLRRVLGKQSIKEDASTNSSQEQNTNGLNEMLTEFSREIQDHLESHMEKTQLQNETDDRKKIQELEWRLSSMNAKLSVDEITIQSLTDDNRRLRTMVYKLKERIANNQMSHFKDSRMDAVYQALARAQVRVVATSMADGTQTILTGANVFSNMAMTGLGARRLVTRHPMGSAGNSLGDSYD